MPDTVPVTIDLEPAAAAMLGDDARRAWVGRIVSRMLQPASIERLIEPRVRGSQHCLDRIGQRAGSIPACAGEPASFATAM